MKTTRKVKVRALSLKYKVDCFFENLHKNNCIHLLYYQIRNWGDAINPTFASFLTSKDIISIDIDANNIYGPSSGKKNYLGIGSIVQHANSNTVIWGGGVQSPINIRNKPLAIHAVRGPMTAKVLRASGLSCPDIFGDPVLLLPRFYQPQNKSKKYKLGIISHVADWQSKLIQKYCNHPEVKLINMRKTDLSLVDDILECEKTISSSLHGLVISDAYGIPCAWLKVSNKIAGNDFKFNDYHAAIRCSANKPLIISQDTTVRNIAKKCSNRELKLNLDDLLESCPYKD